MKRCPQCLRDYYDETLIYCLDDERTLVDGPGDIHSTKASFGEQPTAKLRTSRRPNDESASQIIGADSTLGDDRAGAVAVLPFVNMSPSADSEYFSDGVAEELLNVLSKIRVLRVAARTSAFAFKGKQMGVEDIGRALHVQSILEGSVGVAGEHVRIAVKLVNAENGYHLWSETYDRKMDDIFAIQDDIARSVVGELHSRFLGGETDPTARENVAAEVAKAIRGRAADPEAHRLMLLGRYLLERVNEGDTIRAIGYFRQALDIDPDYALCWAGLGRAFYIASNNGWRVLDADYENAEEALKKALDLEPELAEGHALLGRVRWYRGGDHLQAEQCFRRALDLEPGNITVLVGAAQLARDIGQFEMATEYCRRATAIDPLSPIAWVATVPVHFLAGDMEAAESAARRALELAPQSIWVHACLGLILLKQGRVDEALVEALLEPTGVYWRPWSLTIIHDAAGRRDESDIEFGKLVAEFADSGAFQIAEVYSFRGETDKAFAWLERAVDQRDPGRFATKVSPFLNPLHHDPRWRPLLRKIGFPE